MTAYLSDWPAALVASCEQTYGAVVRVEALGAGQSAAVVWRGVCAGGSVVVKRSAKPQETLFYTQVAPIVQADGVVSPALVWAGAADGHYWLALEDVPQMLPRTRWTADAAVLTTLARLHAIPVETLPHPPGLYHPVWTDALNATAVAFFPLAARARVSALLDNVRRASQHLFAPTCAISGDPNPSNWGVRGDGTVVLFDWERFTCATPALDVAISVPGLPDAATFRRVADVYVRCRASAPTMDASQLAWDCAAAKIWSVTEYIGMVMGGAGKPQSVAQVEQYLVPRFAEWAAGLTGV